MSITTTIALRSARRRPSDVTGKRAVARVSAIVLAFVIWFVFSQIPMGRVGDVPSPVDAVAKLVQLAGTPVYWSSIGSTMLSWSLGLALAVAIGVPVGLMIGSSSRVEVSVRLIVDFLRTIPSVAFLPLALLLFGVSRQMPVALIFFSAVWPLLIQSTYAASQIDPMLKQVRRSFHLSFGQYVRYQFVPSALPFITTGLRVAATICLLTAISVELLSGTPGIGAQLQIALVVSQTATLYAYVLTAGILGVLVNVALVALQRALIWWHPSVRGEAR